jgi:two-component sensor histidine kinase
MGNRQLQSPDRVPEGFTGPPCPADEPQRLIALKRYALLDTPPEEAFDRITRLAAKVFGMPISLISLIDETRQWFKSRHGFEDSWTRREIAFCSYTILDTGALVVGDASKDDRFSTNPLVTGDPNIRFYAGAPLVTPEGHVLGTLCVIDRQPHTDFSAEQQQLLQDLADLVMTELEGRSSLLALRQEIREHKETEKRLHRSLAETEALLREVHHRVRNNLQVVDTLLALQIRQTPACAEDLEELRHRLHCLGMIHHKLMQSPDLQTINLNELIQDLCRSLAHLYQSRQGEIALSVTVEPRDAAVRIDFAISLGLLTTELVTNAYKHAFPPQRHGTVAVALIVMADCQARLTVSDDGIGKAAGSPPARIGQQIISELVDQLGGAMTLDRTRGTEVSVTFPCPTELPC